MFKAVNLTLLTLTKKSQIPGNEEILSTLMAINVRINMQQSWTESNIPPADTLMSIWFWGTPFVSNLTSSFLCFSSSFSRSLFSSSYSRALSSLLRFFNYVLDFYERTSFFSDVSSTLSFIFKYVGKSLACFYSLSLFRFRKK